MEMMAVAMAVEVKEEAVEAVMAAVAKVAAKAAARAAAVLEVVTGAVGSGAAVLVVAELAEEELVGAAWAVAATAQA